MMGLNINHVRAPRCHKNCKFQHLNIYFHGSEQYVSQPLEELMITDRFSSMKWHCWKWHVIYLQVIVTLLSVKCIPMSITSCQHINIYESHVLSPYSNICHCSMWSHYMFIHAWMLIYHSEKTIKLEQLERLRSEDTPRDYPYYWPVRFESQVKRRWKPKKLEKFAKNLSFKILL